jgi:hypothetical protein
MTNEDSGKAEKKSQNAFGYESLVNLLAIGLLKDDVDPKIISAATKIPEGTIRRKFPMKLIKPTATKPNEDKKNRGKKAVRV